MAWTYNLALLESTTAGTFTGSTVGMRYQIRLLIQDNQTARQLLQDEEIDWFQTKEPNVYAAAAACCDTLVARGGSVQSKTVGDLAITYDVKFYGGLALELRGRGATNQLPYCGGISISDKSNNQNNPDNVRPAFARGIEEYPGAPQPTIPPAVPTDGGA